MEKFENKILISETEYFELLRYKKLYLEFIKYEEKDKEEKER